MPTTQQQPTVDYTETGDMTSDQDGRAPDNGTEEDKEYRPDNGNPALRWSKKTANKKKKGRLAFDIQQASDHENIWDGKVVTQEDVAPMDNGEHDGEYSIDDLDKDAQTYDLDALLGNWSFSSSKCSDTAMNPTLGSLVGEEYVPIVGFQPNPAFDSV
ncbi:uncharacterized protein ARMOST_08597 [Armillaria ostoyae]|uniref:Uncharacterized protein n=1 Tax=Armillaria ostoyae TaxID=47428 RepID=A0A284R932_ARMOS|nr:uncharacterized protein ARMOST_08597 [Armillaria ostoyae]